MSSLFSSVKALRDATPRADRPAQIVFALAGLYGCLVLAPMYGLEKAIEARTGPIAYPEYYYGFIGTALAAQALFFVIAGAPRRFRPAMISAILEKFAFAAPVLALYAAGRVQPVVVVMACIDLIWAALFIWSWRATGAYPSAT